MLLNRPVNHLGFAVAHIPEAVQYWSSALGAGPFVLIERMQFDSISHFGEPCTYVHSAAFGQWGAVAIELMQFYELAPPSLAQRIIPGAMPVLNHVAYLSPEPEADSTRLDALGLKLFLRAKFGEVEVSLHDARHAVGYAIEIHRQSAFIEGFFASLAELARGWDGTDPLRPFGG
jgi:methylmalonyl-CoA/ethylmalonyl-CoA epimerase